MMLSARIQSLPIVMTTTAVAELLRTQVATIERYVHSNQLNAIQIGRERRFRAEDVLELICFTQSETFAFVG
jgi:excisionase family DNA binding protein